MNPRQKASTWNLEGRFSGLPAEARGGPHRPKAPLPPIVWHGGEMPPLE